MPRKPPGEKPNELVDTYWPGDPDYERDFKVFAQILCHRAQLFKTCSRATCRRARRCVGKRTEKELTDMRHGRFPPCIINDEKFDVMKEQLPEAMRDMEEQIAKNGFYSFNFDPLNPQRRRQ